MIRRLCFVVLLLLAAVPCRAFQGMGPGPGVMSYGADVTPPQFSSANINGSTLTINWNEACTRGGSYSDSHLNVDMSTTGTDIGVTYQSGDGTTQWVYTTASPAVNGETVDLDFDGTADSIEDGSGNDLGALSSETVTNDTPSTSYLISEDCESGQNGWTTVSGTPVYNHATAPAPLDGSYSFYLDATTTDTVIEKSLGGSQSYVWGFKHIIVYSEASRYLVQLHDATDTVRFSVRVNSSGAVQARSHTTDGAVSTSTMTMDGSTDYYLWWAFDATTGEGWVAFTSDQTAPTAPGADCGTVSANMSCADKGSATTAPTDMQLWAESTVNVSYFDKIRVDDAVIGSNPN